MPENYDTTELVAIIQRLLEYNGQWTVETQYEAIENIRVDLGSHAAETLTKISND